MRSVGRPHDPVLVCADPGSFGSNGNGQPANLLPVNPNGEVKRFGDGDCALVCRPADRGPSIKSSEPNLFFRSGIKHSNFSPLDDRSVAVSDGDAIELVVKRRRRR